MKRISDLVLRIIIIFVSLAVPYQSKSQPSYDFATPSANAMQFFKRQLSGNSLSKGQISLNIPLYELQGKGYSLPISLSFYSGDVTHASHESSVGLGWSLDAGGVIMVNIKGRPDSLHHSRQELPWQYDSSYVWNRLIEYHNFIDMVHNELRGDLMPDSYSYSFPSHVGDIYIDHSPTESGSSTLQMMPDKSCKINKTDSCYIITDEFGNRFFFVDMETCIAGDSFLANTAWYLTWIKTKENGSFHFEYENDTYTNYDQKIYSSYVTNNSLRIKEIVSDYGKVRFETATYTNRNYINRIKIYEGQSLVKEYRLNYGSFSANADMSIESLPTDCRTWNYIRSITEYGSSGQPLPSYEFSYSHNFNYTKSSEGGNQSYADLTQRQRMNDWAPLPTPYVGIDLYPTGGYRILVYEFPNGSQYRDGYYFENPTTGASMEGDYFVLSNVKYPGGATERFIYENHTYDYINDYPVTRKTLHSGLRLKSKQVDDGLGNIVNTTYSYQDGVLFNPSLFVSTVYGNMLSDDMNSHWRADSLYSPKPINASMGQPVYYKIVEECIRNGNYELDAALSGSVLQRKRYYYTNGYTYPPINFMREIRLENVIAGDAYHGISLSSALMDTFGESAISMIHYPFGPLHRPNEPVLDRIETFNGQGTMIQRDEVQYDVESSPVRYGYTIAGEGISQSTHYKNYWIKKQEQTIRYTNPVETETVTTFRNRSLNRISSEGRSKYGDPMVRNYLYADDLQSQNGVSSAVIDTMKQRNMLGTPIMELQYFRGELYSGTYYAYGINNGLVTLDSVMTLYPTSDGTFFNPYIGSNGRIRIPDQFKTTSSYIYEPGNHLPARIKEVGSPAKKIIWDQRRRYPVAIIENYQSNMQNEETFLNLIRTLESFNKVSPLNRGSLKTRYESILSLFQSENSILTLYTYDPGVGMTSMCRSDGTMNFYIYDTFGRLCEILDKDFEVIESYQYHIR